MSSSNWFNEARAWLWAGEPEKALKVARQGMDIAPGVWLRLVLNWSLIANGQFEELQNVIDRDMQSEEDQLAAQINRLAAMGQREEIDPLMTQLQANPELSGFLNFLLDVRIGDREAANRYVRRIDEDPWGSAALVGLVLWCMCGAPWDLEVTPNFAADLEEGNLSWPPPSPIHWPLKDW